MIRYKINDLEKKEQAIKKDIWKTILQVAISILTAIATTLGVTSCM